MSPKAQRIAIAEKCGWRIYKSNGSMYYEQPGGDVYRHGYDIDYLPDYLNDLNAMHEAEKVLTPTQQQHYGDVLGGMFLSDCNHGWRACHATATKRAEAFLRTLNLWDDSK